MTDQRVVVVTGGGGGIGAAIATEVARTGAFVVTLDPLVTVDGAAHLPAAEETTAGRIVASGGAARASSVSVTDAAAVSALFGELVAEFGGLHGVVNVAGISRPTSFTKGSEDDWRSVLDVHLNGYRNVLEAALPIMAAAGRGAILGVTSGSGWRAADAGAYACAKRAVASLTWQLGRVAPPGVVVNAMSPIAATRMVTAALGRAQPSSARPAGPTAASGGLSLASMPQPEEIGPLGAHFVSDDVAWCRGQVIFAGGSELAVIDQPRLIEVLRVDGITSLAAALETVTPGAFVPAEAQQATNGASNSRFGSIFGADALAVDWPATTVQTCAVVCDDRAVGATVVAALDTRGVTGHVVVLDGDAHSFSGAADVLAEIAGQAGALDAVVVALDGGPAAPSATSGWAAVLAEHAELVGQLHADASWTRAVVEYATRSERPVRLVTLTDATTGGGRSRAQAFAQLARSARRASRDGVAAFSVSVETPWVDDGPSSGEFVAHLVCSPDAVALSGAELVVGAGWIGLRSHPRPTGSITYGGPAVPDWLDDVLRTITVEALT